MGAAESMYEEEQESTEDILKIINNIVHTYSRYKIYDCSKIAIVYYNNLIHLPDSDILRKGSAIGLIHPDDGKKDKKEICSKIVDYYRQRVELLLEIENVIMLGQYALLSYEDGNICLGGHMEKCNDPNNVCLHGKMIKGDFHNCSKSFGKWINTTQYKKMMEHPKFGRYQKRIEMDKQILVDKITKYNGWLIKYVNVIKKNMIFKKHMDDEFKKFKIILENKLDEIRNTIIFHKYSLDNSIIEFINENKNDIN